MVKLIALEHSRATRGLIDLAILALVGGVSIYFLMSGKGSKAFLSKMEPCTLEVYPDRLVMVKTGTSAVLDSIELASMTAIEPTYVKNPLNPYSYRKLFGVKVYGEGRAKPFFLEGEDDFLEICGPLLVRVAEQNGFEISDKVRAYLSCSTKPD